MPRGNRIWRDLVRGRTPGQPLEMDVRLTTHQRRNNEALRSRAIAPLGPPQHLSEIEGPPGDTGAAGPGYAATSETELTIATGTQTLTTQADLAYSAGCRARISYDGDNWMEGEVTSYSGAILIVAVDLTAGSGTYQEWNINLAGEPGEAGGPVSTFLDLSDTPASYAGQAGKRPIVTEAEDGLEFSSVGSGDVAVGATAILDGGNLLPDGCFEWDTVAPGYPDRWTIVGSTCSVHILSGDSVAGARCIEFYDRTEAGMTRIVADPANVPDHPGTLPVDANRAYLLSFCARRVGANDGNRVVLHLGCYDRDFTELTTIDLDVNPPAAAWESHSLRIGPDEDAEWPAGAAYVRASIRDLSTGNNAVNRVDAARLILMPEHDEIAAVTADQHHAEDHALDGADHTLAGSTARYIHKATSPTAHALVAPDIRASELAIGTQIRSGYGGLGLGLINDLAFQVDQDGDGVPDWWDFVPGAVGTMTLTTAESYWGAQCLQISRSAGGNVDAYPLFLILSGGGDKNRLMPVNRAQNLWFTLVAKRTNGVLAGNSIEVALVEYAADGTTVLATTSVITREPTTSFVPYFGVFLSSSFNASTRYIAIRLRDASTGATAVNRIGAISAIGSIAVMAVGLGQISEGEIVLGVTSAFGPVMDYLTPGAEDSAFRILSGIPAWRQRIRLIDEPWDDITTWTTVGTGTVEESPDGQLHLLASHGVGTDINAGKYRLAVAPGLKEVTAEILVKFDQLAGGFDGTDGTTRECFEFTFYNGANLLQILFSTDSVWFNTASGVWTKQFDTTFDNTSWYRFRIVCGDTYAYLFVSDDGAAWSYLGACQNAIADATFSGLVRLRVVNFRNAGAATTEVHVDNFTLTPGADWPLIAG